ncbi:hypothetical protein VU03_01175, partial [Desulfobulbus sp. N3]|nr:hypothetical protein [Desulfobulbus sp. N3]
MNTVIVIPIYNEAKAVGQVIEDVRAHGFQHIVVVDFGSTLILQTAALALSLMCGADSPTKP